MGHVSYQKRGPCLLGGPSAHSKHSQANDVLFRLVFVAGITASTLAAASSTFLPQPPSKSAAPKAKATAAATKAAPAEAMAHAAPPVTYVVTGEGNVARYRVRERLAGRELDNDAIGETPKVSGSIALDKSEGGGAHQPTTRLTMRSLTTTIFLTV